VPTGRHARWEGGPRCCGGCRSPSRGAPAAPRKCTWRRRAGKHVTLMQQFRNAGHEISNGNNSGKCGEEDEREAGRGECQGAK